MNNNLNIKEIKNDISKHLETISVMRRIASDLGYDTKEIDKFIATEGSKHIERFEKMSVEELMNFMIADIMENALPNLQ